MNNRINEIHTWLRFKLFAEGDEAKICPEDLVHPNEKIRSLAKELRVLSDSARFRRLGDLYRNTNWID